MPGQFARTELLLGVKALDKLAKSRVIVFGIGGVGGYAVEALVRSGIGEIDIVDNDRVSVSNLNRQIIATQKTIGQYKVDAAKGYKVQRVVTATGTTLTPSGNQYTLSNITDDITINVTFQYNPCLE